MLRLADYFFTFLHVAIIVFNLFGWIPKKTRRANFVLIVLTAASWFLLGIWYGMGYCPITEWQWQVKEKLGERNIPGNFVEYIAEKIVNRDFDSQVISVVTGVSFFLASMASVYVTFLLPYRKKKKD